jgi:hypothetical protein
VCECRGEEANENFTSALPTHGVRRGVRRRTWARRETRGSDGGFGQWGRASRVTSHGLDGAQACACRLHGQKILASGLVPSGGGSSR